MPASHAFLRSWSYKLFLVFLPIWIICTSCSKSNLVTQGKLYLPEEREWLTYFFSDLLFEETAVYTLFGTKPMSLITLYYYSKEEENAYFNSLSEEEKKEGRIIEDYTLHENWEKWEKIAARFPLKRFLLFKTDCKINPSVKRVYFVDILKTSLVLQENYPIFKDILGIDFDPIEVVLHMDKSDFLDKMEEQGNALAWGLLFGYGKSNAYAYYWKYFSENARVRDFLGALSSKRSDLFRTGYGKSTIKNFELPAFVSFDDDDEVVSYYAHEREKIRTYYQGKDFLDATLQKLMRN